MAPNALIELEGLTRHEWLEARRQGIGSSDVAALCGLDRYGSPLSVYLDKIGEADEEPENQYMRMGRVLEPVVADLWCEETGGTVTKPTVIYQDAARPHMIASPDYEVTAPEDGVLECKTHAAGGRLYDDTPPDAVVLQVTHQLLVTERRVGWAAVLVGGLQFRWWRIELNDAVVEPLLDIEAAFWRHVETRTPPPTDGHPATTAALAQLYKTVDLAGVVDATPILAEARALNDVKARIKDLESEKARHENAIRAYLGDAVRATLDRDDVVTWKPTSQFDEERFRKEHPLLAAAHSTVSIKALEEAGHRKLVQEYRTPNAGPRRLVVKEKIG